METVRYHTLLRAAVTNNILLLAVKCVSLEVVNATVQDH